MHACMALKAFLALVLRLVSFKCPLKMKAKKRSNKSINFRVSCSFIDKRTMKISETAVPTTTSNIKFETNAGSSYRRMNNERELMIKLLKVTIMERIL